MVTDRPLRYLGRPYKALEQPFIWGGPFRPPTPYSPYLKVLNYTLYKRWSDSPYLEELNYTLYTLLWIFFCLMKAPVYRWILLALSAKISMAYLPTNLLSLALINSILFSNMKRLFTLLCLKLLKTVLVKEQMQWYKYMVCILESKWAEIYHDLIKTIIIDRDTWYIISAIIH